LVANLARPGGNITGLTFMAHRALEGKRLELLKGAVPGLARVAFLVRGTAAPGEADANRQELNTAARSLRLEVQGFEVSGLDTLAEAFTTMARAPVGAVLLGANTCLSNPTSPRSSPWRARTTSPRSLRGASTWMPAA
jgi:putative tryptophan/tyrosine transport system substrate-binding protein